MVSRSLLSRVCPAGMVVCDGCSLLGESGRNRNYLEHFAFRLSPDTPVVAFWGFILCLMLFFNKHRLLSVFLVDAAHGEWLPGAGF